MPRYVTDMPDSELVRGLHDLLVRLCGERLKFMVELRHFFNKSTGELVDRGEDKTKLIWDLLAYDYDTVVDFYFYDNAYCEQSEVATEHEQGAGYLLASLLTSKEFLQEARFIQHQVLGEKLSPREEQIWLEFTLRYPFDMD